MANTSSAYNLELFDRTAPKVRVVENDKKTQRAIQKHNQKQAVLNIVVIVFLCSILLASFCYLIYEHVQLSDLNAEIDSLNGQIEVLKSEQIGLSSQLCNIASPEKIEKYADDHGMQKMDSNQITYITVEGGDKIGVASGSDNILSRLWFSLKSLF